MRRAWYTYKIIIQDATSETWTVPTQIDNARLIREDIISGDTMSITNEQPASSNHDDGLQVSLNPDFVIAVVRFPIWL